MAENGVLFENCIAASNLTPVCHAALLTGMNPPHNGVRSPYSYLEAQPVADILKEEGYRTAGFVGSGILGSRHGFARGFDTFYEPTKEEAAEILSWANDPEHKDMGFPLGGWWIDQMSTWIGENQDTNFFVFAHFYHTHEGMGESLVHDGRIEEGRLAEFDYLDAKIELADEKIVGTVIQRLKEYNLMEDTIVVLSSDHGTNLGEHGADPVPWRLDQLYPQHRSLYHHDIRVLTIIKGLDIQPGTRVKGIVRHIDVLPTLLENMGIRAHEELDGVDLTAFIKAGEAKDLIAYSEALYDMRPPGAIQALYSESYKFIRNLTKGVEEFFRLKTDPGETINMIHDVSDEERKMLIEWRREMNKMLLVGENKKRFSETEEKEIEGRLRMMGYIE